MINWKPTAAGGIEVRTERTTYTAGQIVFTAGAWNPALIDAIAATNTRPMKQAIGWFGVRRPEHYSIGKFPVFILTTEEEYNFYGFPLWEHPGFKIGGPHLGREPIDPDNPDRTPSARQVALIRDCIARYFPDAAGETLSLKGCIYTCTPDDHFIIDRVPNAPQALVISACSGHGYKFCSVFGEVAADLVTRGTTPFDIAPFAMSRFPTA